MKNPWKKDKIKSNHRSAALENVRSTKYIPLVAGQAFCLGSMLLSSFCRDEEILMSLSVLFMR